MKKYNSTLSGYGTNIFSVMSAMALEYDAINLGQGFPDTDGPQDIRQAAADASKVSKDKFPPDFSHIS